MIPNVVRGLVAVVGVFGLFVAVRFWMDPVGPGAQLGLAALNELGYSSLRADLGSFFGVGGLFALTAARAFRENLKGAAVEAAITYAGFEPIDTTVDFIQMEGDLCRVDFRYTRWQAEDETECGMSWEAWVDVNTMEVLGFAGNTERAAADMELPA